MGIKSWIIAILAAFGVYVFVVDGFVVAPIIYGSHPEIHRTLATDNNVAFDGTGNTSAVLFLPGMQTSGKALIAPVLPRLVEYEDTVVVEYPPHRFDAPVIVEDVYNQLVAWDYHRVTIIGASIGGLLGVDLIDYDRAHGNQIEWRCIFTDVPARPGDLADLTIAELTSWWRVGPLGNLATGPFWDAVYEPQPPEENGPGVDPAQVAAVHAASSSWPLSTELDQVRYILGHPEPAPGSYADIRAVIEQSEHDEVVKPEAAQAWLAIFDTSNHVIVPGAQHIDYAEHPEQWDTALILGLAMLGAWY